MTTPRRIFRIYEALARDAELVRDFQIARGEKVSGTVQLLVERDAERMLRRWGEEMQELADVLDGIHEDPYIVEASQTYYWACLYAVTQGCRWEDLGFELLPREAMSSGMTTTRELRGAVQRVVERGTAAPPVKLFVLWLVADVLYRRQTPPEAQRSLAEIMAYDLAQMRRRDYLHPLLAKITD
ncbi:MAG: hypothetical protein RMM29_00010 [Planctomycetota bacterium]|nr:hypothetical protein [Planctomycetota bacterium]MCX8040792.1 hypothetical protein [Planctomycetota bacterium]MDW8372017.1 hypothetical protein [Planctomycetota bacterium]